MLYGDMLFKLCVLQLGNEFDAEEAMQDTFIKLIYKAPKFNTNEDEKRWIIRVAINIYKDMRKGFWNKKVDKGDILNNFCTTDESKELQELILKLPQKYKEVIYLYYIEGYKAAEISNILKVSQSAVKMRLTRGREVLKSALDD